MNWKDIRTGKEVTWGTGDIKAKIVQPDPRTQECLVETLADYNTPCGVTFRKGFRCSMPANELRYIA
jgi:hypothetical protein